MSASDHNHFLAFLAGLAIGLAHVFLYGFFCKTVKNYLGRAADFVESQASGEPCNEEELCSEICGTNSSQRDAGAARYAGMSEAETETLSEADNSEADQKNDTNKNSSQGIRLFQRIVSFTALCRIAVTAFLAWVAICACSLPVIPVIVGFALATGTGIIKLARTSAKDR